MIGILPPRVPAANCTSGAEVRTALAQIDFCRAREGVGALVLPGNFGRLAVPEQLLTIINLERINRGLAPDVGLAANLDTLAQQGAAIGTDPEFPSTDVRTSQMRPPLVYDSGGSIWAESETVLGADLDWMYVDGAGAGNAACPQAGAAGCWGHRGIILSDQSGQSLVGGGGYAASVRGSDYHSYAFEQLYGFSAPLVYTWSSELPAFAPAPGADRQLAPSVRSVSPKRLDISGGTTVTLTGTHLIGTTAVSFGTVTAAAGHLFCVSETRCTVRAPRHGAGTVRLLARDGAGSSGAHSVSITYG